MAAKLKRLEIVLDGRHAGLLRQDDHGRLSIIYDDGYKRGEGGPGASQMAALMRRVQSPAAARESAEHFAKAMAFNWVIYAPDGHAKNYSVLLRAQEAVPAPLYDISSVLPYPDRYDLRTMAMAMSVNGKYQNNLVTGGDWALLADKLLIDRELMSTWVRDIVVNAADAFADAIHDDAEWVSGLFVAAALVDNVATHAHRLSRFLDTAAPSARRPSRSAKPRPSDS